MAFEDVGTSTMERDGPLAPSIVEQIKRAAAEKAKLDYAVQAYRAGYNATSGSISEQQAREELLNNPALLALFGGTPQPHRRTAEVKTKARQPLPAKKATARKTGSLPRKAVHSKKTNPIAPSPVAEKSGSETAPPVESVLRERPLPKFKFKEDFLVRLKRTAKKLNVAPESLLRWFTVSFLLRWDRAALEYNIPAEFLIKMNPNGTPADPARRARYLQGWDKRREAEGLPPKKRVAVSPELQVKRSRRGFKALATKLNQIENEKPWLDTEEQRRAMLTNRAVSKNRRVARAAARQAASQKAA